MGKACLPPPSFLQRSEPAGTMRRTVLCASLLCAVFWHLLQDLSKSQADVGLEAERYCSTGPCADVAA